MAREVRTRKSEGKVTIVEPPVQRRSSRLSDAAPKSYRYVSKQANSPLIQRPVGAVPTKNTQKAPKAKHVNIAGILKKPQKAKTSHVSKKQQKRREETPDLDLIADLQGTYGIDAARTHLSTSAKANFASIHNGFNSKLQDIHDEDTAFLQHVSETAATLSIHLLDEKLETEIRRDGKCVVETVEIGKRVEAFKALIEQEEAKLKQAWREWDEVQEEYIELGIDAFGAEVFGRTEGENGGYKKEMEMLDLEHKTRVEELEEGIEEISAEALQKMKASEKELDAVTRREQARLLQALL